MGHLDDICDWCVGGVDMYEKEGCLAAVKTLVQATKMSRKQ